MSLAMQILINDTSREHERDIVQAVKDIVNGQGFCLEVEEFTPAEDVLTELGAVEQGRASVKTFTA